MSLTVNKSVTVGRGYGVISLLAAKTEQKQRKSLRPITHPVLSAYVLYIHSTFFPAEQSIGDSVTRANCFPSSHLLSSQIHLMLGLKKKKVKMRNQ